ncbi:MAG: AglZ/HisF2 family acetamidino modification protein [Flavisolibacter sp.]
MVRTRVIPCLLWKDGGLYKSVKFKKLTYVGDPINAIKIFNEKEVDELIILDIDASKEKREPNYELIRQVASECFMPLGYGGGVNSLDHIQKLLSLGVEKIVVQTAAVRNKEFIREATNRFGSSTIVVSIDYKSNLFGKNRVTGLKGQLTTSVSPEEFAKEMEEMGAGEIILQSIDRDGTFSGYDLDTIRKVVQSVSIPVVCLGGAGDLKDIANAIQAGVSGAAAGSIFVFQKPHRAVLISYPTGKEWDAVV